MTNPDKSIELIKEALRHAPDNAALREHLARSLLDLHRSAEAETEFLQLLKQSPENQSLELGLAEAYFQQGKDNHALVIIEPMISSRDTPAEAYLLHARLLLRKGEVAFAETEYRCAIEANPELADTDLEERLGIDDDTAEIESTEGRLRAGWEGEPQEPHIDLERPDLNFEKVGGMHDLKEEIRMKIIYPLQHPEMFAAYGKSIGGGILMYGPPGCGKTHLARATAGEIRANFMSVGINDVLDMWIGNSERNLHDLFERARRNTPCVLFFDEVDALGASRSDMKTSAGRHLINQFLAEMDGVQSQNEGILILAATNAPWSVDTAFRRPGRFDRVLFVPPPDRTARAEILRVLLEGKPVEKIDHDWLATKTDHFSGADLKAVIDAAIEDKLREAMKTGRPEPLTSKDLIHCAKRIKPTTQDWFGTARNYALYSNQSGLYDDILKYLDLR